MSILRSHFCVGVLCTDFPQAMRVIAVNLTKGVLPAQPVAPLGPQSHRPVRSQHHRAPVGTPSKAFATPIPTRSTVSRSVDVAQPRSRNVFGVLRSRGSHHNPSCVHHHVANTSAACILAPLAPYVAINDAHTDTPVTRSWQARYALMLLSDVHATRGAPLAGTRSACQSCYHPLALRMRGAQEQALHVTPLTQCVGLVASIACGAANQPPCTPTSVFIPPPLLWRLLLEVLNKVSCLDCFPPDRVFTPSCAVSQVSSDSPLASAIDATMPVDVALGCLRGEVVNTGSNSAASLFSVTSRRACASAVAHAIKTGVLPPPSSAQVAARADSLRATARAACVVLALSRGCVVPDVSTDTTPDAQQAAMRACAARVNCRMCDAQQPLHDRLWFKPGAWTRIVSTVTSLLQLFPVAALIAPPTPVDPLQGTSGEPVSLVLRISCCTGSRGRQPVGAARRSLPPRTPRVPSIGTRTSRRDVPHRRRPCSPPPNGSATPTERGSKPLQRPFDAPRIVQRALLPTSPPPAKQSSVPPPSIQSPPIAVTGQRPRCVDVPAQGAPPSSSSAAAPVVSTSMGALPMSPNASARVTDCAPSRPPLRPIHLAPVPQQ